MIILGPPRRQPGRHPIPSMAESREDDEGRAGRRWLVGSGPACPRSGLRDLAGGDAGPGVGVRAMGDLAPVAVRPAAPFVTRLLAGGRRSRPWRHITSPVTMCTPGAPRDAIPRRCGCCYPAARPAVPVGANAACAGAGE